jgi:hypothetical protein
MPSATDGPKPYTLRAPHWHADTLHPAGTVLDLYPDQIERVRAAEEAVAAKTAQQLKTAQQHKAEVNHA